MKPFISCNHPVRVNTSKGIRFVSCGHCIQCMNAKRSRTSLLLDLEGQHSQYVEFLTLTYSDSFIPRLDFQKYYDNLSTLGLSFDDIPISFGNRVVRNFGRISHDSSFDNVFVPFHLKTKYYGYSELSSLLKKYNSRVDAYFTRFPERRRGIRQYNIVPILWYPDLQKFIKRLRAFTKKTFDVKFRYFAIGEYGTNSLRPHWHILLCHNSSRLHRIFDDVVDLPFSTPENPRQCSTLLFNSQIWQYGDCVTSTTDKGLSSYLASYVNQSSDFPAILAPYGQKTFHSIFLGEHRDFKQVASLFRSGDFEQLCSTPLLDSKGVERVVSVPSASYARFNIRLTSVGLQDAQTSYDLLFQTGRYVDRYFEETGEVINVFNETSLYSFYIWYRSLNVRSTLLSSYFDIVVSPAFVHRGTLNPLFQLVYGYKKLYKMSNLLGMSRYQYLSQLARFRSWLDLRNLSTLYHMLELDDNYAYQYYSVLDPVTGAYDLNKLFTSQLFMSQQTLANIAYWSDIKHRDVSDSYKF